ncbi:molybdopterin biosynthesis protein, partial [Paracoccus thiocyanatus]
MLAVLIAARLLGWPQWRGWAAVAGLWLAAIAVLALSPESAAARLSRR